MELSLRSRVGSRLTIVIVSHNCKEHVRRCLDSIERETCERNYGVVLVDNASSDGTVDMVGERYSWVDLQPSEENLGFSAANNAVLREATSEFILLLNPDTIVPYGTLSACLRSLEQRPTVGMLGCKLVTPQGTLDHACKRGFPTPLSSLYYFVGLNRIRPTSRRFSGYTAGHIAPDEEAEVDAVNGAMMLVRRQAVLEVGLLDESFWLYMEDLDWCYRFWKKGWPVVYWPGQTIIHVKGGSSSERRGWRANKAFHDGMWIFYRKHYLAERPLLVSGLVRVGVWAKLAASAARSGVLRAVAS